RLRADIHRAYERREGELGAPILRDLESRVLLAVIDRKWREHLYEMDYLREGIGLRAMAQRDPLAEYQREGYDLFAAMMDAIKEETIGLLFNIEVQVAPPTTKSASDGESSEAAAAPQPSPAPRVVAKGLTEPQRPTQLSYSAPSVDSA